MNTQWSTVYAKDDETGARLAPITVKRDNVRRITETLRKDGCSVTHVVHNQNVNVIDHGIYIDGTGF